MEFKIYGQSAPVGKPSVTLRLIRDEDNGGISLVAVDKLGRDRPAGYLVTLKPNGTVYLHHSINPALGFTCDADSRLEVSPDYA